MFVFVHWRQLDGKIDGEHRLKILSTRGVGLWLGYVRHTQLIMVRFIVFTTLADGHMTRMKILEASFCV